MPRKTQFSPLMIMMLIAIAAHSESAHVFEMLTYKLKPAAKQHEST